MSAGGRTRLLVAIAAVLGLTLGSSGCESTAGPATSLATVRAQDAEYTPYTVRADGRNSRPDAIPVSYGQSAPEGDQAPGNEGLPAPRAMPAPANPGPAALAVMPTPVPGSATPMPGHGDYPPGAPGCTGPVPTELYRTSLPPYTIAPPDILFIDSLRLVPKPPYRIEPLEVLLIKVTETLPGQPIEGAYTVSPEGTINLGFTYGAVKVAGLTLDQIQAAIRTHLTNILRNPQVVVALSQFRAIQQTRGEHLVRPDGTISLGTYGCVYVAGLTVNQAKCEIEKYMSRYFLNPQIAVDVFAYNSKVYYVIFDGGGFGMQVFPFPITGNETVLDAIARTNGLAPVSSMRRIWVARPAPPGHPCDQILPVDWLAIVKGGSTCTNYQLFPGDRVYVDADCLIKVDNWLAKFFSPIERVLGITLLGSSTVNSFRNNNNGNNNGTGIFVP
jgi:polysaccharide export outer membrane protein